MREIETTALQLRDGELPSFGLELEETAIDVALPTDRPLLTVRPASEVNSELDPVELEEVDTSVLANQVVVDPARLATRIRALIPVHGTARLEDIISMYPLQHGAAEIVGYLALNEDDLEVTTHEHEETVIEYHEAFRAAKLRPKAARFRSLCFRRAASRDPMSQQRQDDEMPCRSTAFLLWQSGCRNHEHAHAYQLTLRVPCQQDLVGPVISVIENS